MKVFLLKESLAIFCVWAAVCVEALLILGITVFVIVLDTNLYEKKKGKSYVFEWWYWWCRLKGLLLTQPAEYQVANYNIYPSPTISIEDGIDPNLEVQAYLIERESGIVIDKGNMLNQVNSNYQDFKLVMFDHLVPKPKPCILIALN